MSGQAPYMSAPQYGYPTGFQQVNSKEFDCHPNEYRSFFLQRDVRYPGGSAVETAMGINRRPSILAGYHGHFSSPERFIIELLKKIPTNIYIVFRFRTSMPPYLFSLAAPVSMGPHVDEHSKRSRYPSSIPLLIDVKKVYCLLIMNDSFIF